MAKGGQVANLDERLEILVFPCKGRSKMATCPRVGGVTVFSRGAATDGSQG